MAFKIVRKYATDCVKVDYLYGPSPIKAIRASGSSSITLLKHEFQMSAIGEGGGKGV